MSQFGIMIPERRRDTKRAWEESTEAVADELDDAVSHGFGVWTPLDWVWTVAIYPLVG